MLRARNLVAALVALAVLAVIPLSAMAEEARSDSDRPVDTIQPVERPQPSDEVKPSDRPSDKPIREVDEADKVRHRCLLTDNPRRCLHDDRPHDFDVRKLIWRLIKAGEWKKLFRLLHWLGLI